MTLLTSWGEGRPDYADNISGQPVINSGNTIVISSGLIDVFVQSGIEVMVDVSGDPVIISGQPVTISGDHVFVESGVYVIAQVNVVVSGIDVTVDISGDPVSISGQPVTISGDHVFVESGAVVGVSGQLIQAHVISGILDIVNISISGQPVTVSGDHMFVESGHYGIVEVISGAQVITQPGACVYSGEIHVISGIVNIYSGIMDLVNPSEAIVNPTVNPQLITSASGGEPLTSNAIKSLILKCATSNAGPIYLGGHNDKPYDGGGMELFAGEAINMDVDNVGKIWACAGTSGDKITYIAVKL